MPGIPIKFEGGTPSYVPAAGVTITGGQLIEARAGGRVGPAAAASVHCLGVALTDAVSPEAVVNTPTLVGGRQVLNAVPQATVVAVADDKIVPVTYAAAAAFGDLLIAAANGQVTPAGANPDCRTIVGRCVEPLGISGAGIVGLMRGGD